MVDTGVRALSSRELYNWLGMVTEPLTWGQIFVDQVTQPHNAMHARAPVIFSGTVERTMLKCASLSLPLSGKNSNKPTNQPLLSSSECMPHASPLLLQGTRT